MTCMYIGEKQTKGKKIRLIKIIMLFIHVIGKISSSKYVKIVYGICIYVCVCGYIYKTSSDEGREYTSN